MSIETRHYFSAWLQAAAAMIFLGGVWLAYRLQPNELAIENSGHFLWKTVKS